MFVRFYADQISEDITETKTEMTNMTEIPAEVYTAIVFQISHWNNKFWPF